MVGQHQAVGRDERAGAAALEASDGALQFIQPRLLQRCAIFLLDGGLRDIVESPHAFIGAGRGGEQCQAGGGETSEHRILLVYRRI
jgi:hypothetical protein